MTHDPLCPCAEKRSDCRCAQCKSWEQHICECSFIAKVRADEREKAARRVTKFFWPDGGSWMSANTTFDRLGRGAVQAIRGES